MLFPTAPFAPLVLLGPLPATPLVALLPLLLLLLLPVLGRPVLPAPGLCFGGSADKDGRLGQEAGSVRGCLQGGVRLNRCGPADTPEGRHPGHRPRKPKVLLLLLMLLLLLVLPLRLLGLLVLPELPLKA